MTPRSETWFVRMGFEVWHVPGVSRAWRRELDDGSCVLATDVGRFDLPSEGGPYSGLHLSREQELLEFVPLLRRSKDLHRWLRHAERAVRSTRCAL